MTKQELFEVEYLDGPESGQRYKFYFYAGASLTAAAIRWVQQCEAQNVEFPIASGLEDVALRVRRDGSSKYEDIRVSGDPAPRYRAECLGPTEDRPS